MKLKDSDFFTRQTTIVFVGNGECYFYPNDETIMEEYFESLEELNPNPFLSSD